MDTLAVKEKIIQGQILSYLEARGDWFGWRQNSGTAQIGGRFVSMGMPGCPDIIGCWAPSGMFLGIEVKSATGRQNPDQIRFQEFLERAGGGYILARSVTDVALRMGEPRVKLILKRQRAYPGCTED